MTRQPRKTQDIYLEVDAGTYTPRPMVGEELRKHLEQLKKHRPEEYARIIKNPEIRRRLKDGTQDSSKPTAD